MAAAGMMTVIKQEPVSPTTNQPESAFTWTRIVGPPLLSATDNTHAPVMKVNPIKTEVNTNWANPSVSSFVVPSFNVTPVQSHNTASGNAMMGFEDNCAGPQSIYQHDAPNGGNVNSSIPVLLNNKTVGELTLGTKTLSISMREFTSSAKQAGIKPQTAETNFQMPELDFTPHARQRLLHKNDQVTEEVLFMPRKSKRGRRKKYSMKPKMTETCLQESENSPYQCGQYRKICKKPPTLETNILSGPIYALSGRQKILPKNLQGKKDFLDMLKKHPMLHQKTETNFQMPKHEPQVPDIPGSKKRGRPRKNRLKPPIAETDFQMHEHCPARRGRSRKFQPNMTEAILQAPQQNSPHQDQLKENQLLSQVSEHEVPIAFCVQPEIKEENAELAENPSTVNSPDQGSSSTANEVLPMIESYYSMKKMTLHEMIEILDSGYDVMNFFKADSPDYKRALIFCEAAKKHNIKGIHPGILADEAFFESLVSLHITEFEIALFKADIKNTLKLGGSDHQQKEDINSSIMKDDSNIDVGCIEKVSDVVSSDKNATQRKESSSKAMSLKLSVAVDMEHQSETVTDIDKMQYKQETNESISVNVSEVSDQLMEEERVRKAFSLSSFKTKCQRSITSSSETLSYVNKPTTETSAVKSNSENVSKLFGNSSSVDSVSSITQVPHVSALTSSESVDQFDASINQDTPSNNTDKEPTVYSVNSEEEESELDEEETRIDLNDVDVTRISHRDTDSLPKWNYSIIKLVNFNREIDKHLGKSCSGGEFFYCYLCNHTSESSKCLVEHIAEVHRDPEKRVKKPGRQSYVCSHCDLRLLDLATVEEHELRFHLSECPCYFCGISIHTQKEFLQHIYDFHCQQIFKCQTCGVQLFGNHELTKHVKKWKHLKPQDSIGCVCLYCYHLCTDFNNLSKHVTKYHFNKPLPNKDECCCYSCRHVFLDDQALNVHKNACRFSSKGRFFVNYSLVSAVSMENCTLLSELKSCSGDKQRNSESCWVFGFEWIWWKQYLIEVEDIVRTVCMNNKTFSYPYGELAFLCKVRRTSEEVVEKLPMTLDKLVQITMIKFKQLQNVNTITLDASVLEMLSIVSACDDYLKFLKNINMENQFQLVCKKPFHEEMCLDLMVHVRGKFYMYPYKAVRDFCAVENVNFDVLPGIFDGLLRLVFEVFPQLDPKVCFKSHDFWKIIVAVSRTPLFLHFLKVAELSPFPWNKHVKHRINSLLCDFQNGNNGIISELSIAKCVLPSGLSCDKNIRTAKDVEMVQVAVSGNVLLRQIFDIRFWEDVCSIKDKEKGMARQEKMNSHNEDCTDSGKNTSVNARHLLKEQEKRPSSEQSILTSSLVANNEKAASNFMINVRGIDARHVLKEQEKRPSSEQSILTSSLVANDEKAASYFMINVRKIDDDADKKSLSCSVTRKRKYQREMREDDVGMHHEMESACKTRKVSFGSKARNIETVDATMVLPSCTRNFNCVKCSVVVLKRNAMAEEMVTKLDHYENHQRNSIGTSLKKRLADDVERPGICNITGSPTRRIIQELNLKVEPVLNEETQEKSLRPRKQEISYYESDQGSAESDSDDDLSPLDENDDPLSEAVNKISPKFNTCGTLQPLLPVQLGCSTKQSSTCRSSSSSITCTGSMVSQATSCHLTTLSSASTTTGISAGSVNAMPTVKQEPIDPYFMHSDGLYNPTTSASSASFPLALLSALTKKYDAPPAGNTDKKMDASSLQSELAHPTPSSLQQAGRTPPGLQQAVKTRKLQQIAPAPSCLQQVDRIPSSLQQVVQTPSGLLQVVQTPSGLLQVVQTPSSLKQIVQKPSDVQVQTAGKLRQMVPTPSSLQQVIQMPSGLKQVVQTPSGLQQLVQTPSGLQQIVQTPPGLQQVVQMQSGSPQVVQTPSSCINSSSVFIQNQSNTYSLMNNPALGLNTQLVYPSGMSQLPGLPILQLPQNNRIFNNGIVQSNPVILGNNIRIPFVNQPSLGIQNTVSHGCQGSVGNVAQSPNLKSQVMNVPVLGSGGLKTVTDNSSIMPGQFFFVAVGDNNVIGDSKTKLPKSKKS